jgi:hypothetical protein
MLPEDSAVPGSAIPMSTAVPVLTANGAGRNRKIYETLARKCPTEDPTWKTIHQTKKSTKCDRGAVPAANTDSHHPPMRTIPDTAAVTQLSPAEAVLILVEAVSMHNHRTTTTSHATICPTVAKTSTHNAVLVSEATAEDHHATRHPRRT